eukprot:jgi/Pico_ML_1/51438/g2468.t1
MDGHKDVFEVPFAATEAHVKADKEGGKEMTSRFSRTSDLVQRVVSTTLALTTLAGGTWLVANMGKGFAHYHRIDQAKRDKEAKERE